MGNTGRIEYAQWKWQLHDGRLDIESLQKLDEQAIIGRQLVIEPEPELAQAFIFEIHGLVAGRQADWRAFDGSGTGSDQSSAGGLLIEIAIDELRLDIGALHLRSDSLQHFGVRQAVAAVEKQRVARGFHGLRTPFVHRIVDALVRLDGNFRLGIVQRLQPLDTAIGGRAIDDDPAKVSTGLTAQALVGIAQSVQIIPVYSYDTETDHNSPVRYLHLRFFHWPEPWRNKGRTQRPSHIRRRKMSAHWTA